MSPTNMVTAAWLCQIFWVTHQKKILRGSKKILGGDQKKNIKSIKKKYCTYKIVANLGRVVKTSAPWGIKKKILLEIHVEGRRSRNTSLRSALIFSPDSFSCRGSIFCDPSMNSSSRTRPFAEVTFRASETHFVWKITTSRAPAIYPNFTEYCACHKKVTLQDPQMLRQPQ